MKKTLFFLFMALAYSSSNAETPSTIEADGTTFYYYMNDDGDNTITLTNQEGGAWVLPCDYSGDITIPNWITAYDDGFTVENLIVTEISDYAFAYPYDNITSMRFDGTTSYITKIGYRAFVYCFGFNDIKIPKGVISIGEQAFCECVKATRLFIPESVKTIGDGAFDACYGLRDVYIKGTTIPEFGNDVFRGAFFDSTGQRFHEDATLYVSYGMKDAYYEALGKYFDYDQIIEYYDLPEALPTVTTTTKSVVGYYDLSGRKLTAPTGVTIIRYSDGTAEKILAK